MRSINDYSEYLATLKETSSKDPVVRYEAKKALEILQKDAPDRYTLYRILNKEIEAPKEEAPKGKRIVYDKEKFIREHPEIDVRDLRKKAKERLIKGSYGFGLHYELPSWLTEENLLKSVDQLTVSELITGSGKPVPRQTLLRKCIKIAIEEKRIDEGMVRDALKHDDPWSSSANRQNMLIVALSAIDVVDEKKIVDVTFFYYKPVFKLLPREIRRQAKKAFCSACSKVISAKGVQCFICTDGTINVDKVLRSIPKKGNEELFEMLLARKASLGEAGP